MKGDATTHTTNAAYRAGWERVFGPKPESHECYWCETERTARTHRVACPCVCHGDTR